jgi:hypothetical protein
MNGSAVCWPWDWFLPLFEYRALENHVLIAAVQQMQKAGVAAGLYYRYASDH